MTEIAMVMLKVKDNKPKQNWINFVASKFVGFGKFAIDDLKETYHQ